MNLSNLKELKQRVASAKDLAAPFRYFLDHFGEDPAFLDMGRRVQNPVLEALLSAVAGQMAPGANAVRDLLLIELADHGFIHGNCRFHGRNANLLFFTDIAVGIVAVSPPRPGDATNYCRFTARRAGEGEVPSAN
ncbi:MAG TPA: hypothetical protein VFC78_12155 [Tepidisphaeraceae bacterium]|nr:hypothetical protein [Tepidisphaeraceae bacterium]